MHYALTQVQTGTWSEQHRDMTFSGRKHDHDDLYKFKLFLHQHSPFCQADKTSLVNITTGVVADCRVNTDQAITVGWHVHSNLTGQRFGDVSLRKADQATTFKYMHKPVKIQNENMYMSSSEMYQRLLSIECIAGPPDTTVFSHELAAVAPSLFHNDGTTILRSCIRWCSGSPSPIMAQTWINGDCMWTVQGYSYSSCEWSGMYCLWQL